MIDLPIQNLLSKLPLVFALIAYLNLALLSVLLLSYRKVNALRRRLAAEEASRHSLMTRFEEAVALLEDRLSLLESGGRNRHREIKQRREAVRSIRTGADPVVAAKRFRLPRPEMQLLIELHALRRSAARTCS